MGKYKGILLQKRKGKGYDSGVLIHNPDWVFVLAEGSDFRATVPLYLLSDLLGVFRKAKGFSEKDIGDKVGRYQSVIEKIEKGAIDITIQDAQYYANALDLEIEIVIKNKE